MNILALYDDSKEAVKALSYALLFMDRGYRLMILYIVDISQYLSAKELEEGEEKVNQVITGLEAKIRKKLSSFLRSCEEKNVDSKCTFKISKIVDGFVEEVISGKYEMIIIPLSENIKERIAPLIEKVLENFKGLILFVR